MDNELYTFLWPAKRIGHHNIKNEKWFSTGTMCKLEEKIQNVV